MLLFSHLSVSAGITDLKLSTAQIFDVQWNISGGKLNASGFNYIYSSVNYATQTTSAARWTAAQTADANSNGRYIGFFNSTTNPGTYGMAVFNSDGSTYKIINNTGSFRALADGAIFYNGNGMWGTLITTGQGYNLGQSGNWAVTQDNPNNTQLQAYTPPSSTPLAAGQTAAPSGPPPPDWKAIRTNSTPVVISNIYPTSNNSPPGEGANNAFDGNTNTKYLNFDKKNAGVTVKLSQGRVVQKFTVTTANDFSGRDPTSYILYGSHDGVNWIKIKEDAIALSETRYWTSPEITVANTTAYIYYFILFPTTKAGDGCGLDCDSMQIAEVTYYYDLNDGVTSTDTGTGTVSNPGSLCCGGSSAAFSANSSFTARVNTFKNRTTADSQVYIEQIGNDNTVVVKQSGSRNNYVDYFGNGSFNNVNITQSGNASTQANYIEANVGTGGSASNSNTVTLTQQSTGGTKGILLNVTNSNNTINVQQKDAGSHYAEIAVSGGNKDVNIIQQGSASHMANVNLSGTATNLDLTQSGTTQQYYSITHTCALANGCAAISVTQGQ
jgi:hypothetical protein